MKKKKEKKKDKERRRNKEKERKTERRRNLKKEKERQKERKKKQTETGQATSAISLPHMTCAADNLSTRSGRNCDVRFDTRCRGLEDQPILEPPGALCSGLWLSG